LRRLAKTWPTGEPPWEEDEHQRLQAEAVQERLVTLAVHLDSNDDDAMMRV